MSPPPPPHLTTPTTTTRENPSPILLSLPPPRRIVAKEKGRPGPGPGPSPHILYASSPPRRQGRPGPSPPIPATSPPRRQGIYKNNGYLMISCNGGLNQMRATICDMVTVAIYSNVILSELDKTSFWADPRCFAISRA